MERVLILGGIGDKTKVLKCPMYFLIPRSYRIICLNQSQILDQGIAEYSHKNFLSYDTVFDDGQSETINTLHNLGGITMADVGGIVSPEEKQFGSKKVYLLLCDE